MNEIALGAHRLRWSEQGDGEPVVLVHSSGMSARQWRRLAEVLSGSHRPLSVDLLGYGASTAWPEGETAHFVHDLLALERLLDVVGPAHLVGHSYGGFLSLLLALHRPAHVRSLAVYEPVSFGTLRSSGEAEALATVLSFDRAPVAPVTEAEHEAWLDAFIAYWNGPGAWQELAPAIRDGFRAVARKVVGEVRSLSEERTPHDAYATIAVPTLLLGGARSTLAADRVLGVLARTIPGAERVVVEGAGHMGPLTHAAEVNARIVAHLGVARR